MCKIYKTVIHNFSIFVSKTPNPVERIMSLIGSVDPV